MQKLLMKYRENRVNNKGFTLVELIVVIAILGVLMAVLVPQYIKYVDKARAGTDMAALGEVLHAAEIDAALSGEEQTYDIAMADGTVTIPAALQDTLGASITLTSSEGKELTDQTIKVTTDGKAGWGAGQATTAATFTDLAALAK